MNAVFQVLYYKPEFRRRIEDGADPEEFKRPECVLYKIIGLNLRRVESFVEAAHFKNHTEITMYSGDVWVIKISAEDYARLIKHVDAGKLICKLNN